MIAWIHKVLPLFYATNVPVKSKLQHPQPQGQPPGHLNFWKIFVQIPPSLGRKAVQMPHTGKLPDSCFNFSVASIKLLRLHMLYYRYKSFLNTFKYRTQLVQAFVLQPICHKYTIFPLNSSKSVSAVSAMHDLSTHV